MTRRMVPAETLDADSWVREARRAPSPNCDVRPQGVPVRLIVIHAISLPPGQFGGDAIELLFANRLDPSAHPHFREIHHLRVSAHFLIRRDGELVQFVPCSMRAWHAGASSWRGLGRCNDFSIGIELEGCDDRPFDPAQYRTLRRLVAVLARSYPIQDIVGHSDIAPGRKTDPGPHFEWQRLRASLARPAR